MQENDFISRNNKPPITHFHDPVKFSKCSSGAALCGRKLADVYRVSNKIDDCTCKNCLRQHERCAVAA